MPSPRPDARQRVSDHCETVQRRLKRFEEERQALIKKYGKLGMDGAFSVPPENMAAFTEDFKTLTAIAVDLSITPVAILSLGEAVKLSASDMLILERFLKE